MSGSQLQVPGQPGIGQGNVAGADPSMEDILASIRRILSEEDAPAVAPPGPRVPDILILDDTMLVPEATHAPVPHPGAGPQPPPQPPPPASAAHGDLDASVAMRPPPAEAPPEPPMPLIFPGATAASAYLGEPAPAPVPAAEMPPRLPPRMPAPPVLVPVPLSGQPDPEPLIRLPAAIAPVAPRAILTPVPAPPATVATVATAATAPLAPTPLGLEPHAPPVGQAELPRAQPQQTAETISMNGSTPSPLGSATGGPAAVGLASPEAAAAAAGAVSNLVRALTSDRNAQVHSGGPTIADLVREEMRPMVKAWLDNNLPPLVERLVRAEIERVISRAAI